MTTTPTGEHIFSGPQELALMQIDIAERAQAKHPGTSRGDWQDATIHVMEQKLEMLPKERKARFAKAGIVFEDIVQAAKELGIKGKCVLP